MELSRNSVEKSRKREGLGHCRHFFWLGVAFDTVGATVLFMGVFADLLFNDLLLYMGSIIIFFSLLWWVFWYTSNIELSPEEALKRSYRVPMVDGPQTVSQRFSVAISNVSNTLVRIWQGWCRERLLPRGRSPSMSVIDQAQKQLAEEGQDKDGMKSVKKNGDAEDFGRQALGPEPEAVKSSKGVCAPRPDAGPLGPREGRPSSHLVQPVFPVSPVDQPVPPAILASKSQPMVPLSSTSQPLAILYSQSLPIVFSASTSQPPVTLTSTSLPAIPLSSTGQPLDTLSSKIQTAAPLVSQSHPLMSLASQSHCLVPVASQNHSLVPAASQSYPLVCVAAQSHLPSLVASQSHRLLSVAAQSHLQVPVASESNFQNLSPASQTQPPSVGTSQAEALATPVSLVQLLPAPSFQTQPVDPQVTLTVQHFQALYDTQQAPKSSDLVQEIALSQSSHAQEPPAGQELSQEVSDTVSLLPKSLAPSTEAQQSAPLDSVPAPTPESSRPL